MSSEALERAQKALRTPDLEWAGDLVHGLANDVLALSAELDEARADYWRDVAAHYQAKVAAEAALAVAREREQRAVRALRSLRGWAYVESIAHGIEMPPNLAALLDAALVDEPAATLNRGFMSPAATTLTEPEEPSEPVSEATGADASHSQAQGDSGSASAAADEPGETP